MAGLLMSLSRTTARFGLTIRRTGGALGQQIRSAIEALGPPAEKR